MPADGHLELVERGWSAPKDPHVTIPLVQSHAHVFTNQCRCIIRINGGGCKAHQLLLIAWPSMRKQHQRGTAVQNRCSQARVQSEGEDVLATLSKWRELNNSLTTATSQSR